jgi:hypothetical protein
MVEAVRTYPVRMADAIQQEKLIDDLTARKIATFRPYDLEYLCMSAPEIAQPPE